MPDVFGFETPEEAILRLRSEQEERLRAFQSGPLATTPGARVGVALSQIFGGTVRKALDTREARRDRTTQLMEDEGLTEEQARDRARREISPEFKEVRQAKNIEDASNELNKLVTNVAPIIGPEKARAVGMLHMAQRLRQNGMANEATEIAVQGAELFRKAENMELERRKLKASTQQEEIGVEQAEATLRQTGLTGFAQDGLLLEELRGQLAQTVDPEERNSINRRIGALEAKQLKDVTLTGRTEFDVLGDEVFLRKQMEAFVTDDLLLTKLELADEALNDIEGFAATAAGRLGARTLGFLEDSFGRTPDESEQAFINRVVRNQGGSAFVAAQVRHALTGAQMSAFEIKFLEPFLPNPGDAKSIMRAKIRTLQEYTALNANARLALIQSGKLNEFFTQGGTSTRSSETEVLAPSSIINTEDVEAAGDNIFQSVLDIVDGRTDN